MEPCCKYECKCNEDVQRLLARYREYYDEALPSIEALEFVLERFRAPLEQLEDEIRAIVIKNERSAVGHGVAAIYRPILSSEGLISVKPAVVFKVEKVE